MSILNFCGYDATTRDKLDMESLAAYDSTTWAPSTTGITAQGYPPESFIYQKYVNGDKNGAQKENHP